MFRLWLSLCVLVAVPTGAVAQTVAIQSGEHAAFTRLVLDIGAERTYTLAQEGARATLSVDPGVDGFDMSRVFDFIPRDRLSDLASGEGRLDLDLACNCPVTAFRYQERYVVIDIRDTSSADPVPSADQPSAARPEDAPVAAARRLAAAEAIPDLTGLLRAPQAPSTPSVETANPDVDIAPQDPAVVGGTEPVATESIDDATVLMAEQLARAAAAGLLNPAGGGAITDTAAVLRGSRLTDALSMAMPDASGLPLRAQTAADAASGGPNSGGIQTPRLSCEQGYGDVFDWQPEISFDVDLGPLRRALYDDRGILRSEGAENLARHYIFSGFGAEGAFWLGQMQTAPDYLSILAGIVDGVSGPHFPPLNGNAPCDDAALFWRYVDGGDVPDLTSDQAGTIQLLAARLPDHLRAHLVPRIARRLSADGHANVARNLRDMLVRSGQIGSAGILHLDLDLGIPPDTSANQTRETLALALRDDGANAPAAMAQALRFDRNTGVVASPVRLDAAAALLRETGPTPDGMNLWRELVLSLVDANEINEALRYLADDFADAETRSRTLTEVVADRVAAGDVATLMLVAHGFGEDWTETGSDAGRSRVAAMALLRSEGFPDAANRFRSAMQTLILPARPSMDPSIDGMVHDAWLSRDWDRIEALTDGPHSALAARMADLPAGAAAPEEIRLPTLQAAVDDSRALREMLEDILVTPSPTASGPSQ